MAVQIQIRRGTAAAWTSADPTLAEGEIGLETNTGKFKFGDGSTVWHLLPYVATGGSVADILDLPTAETDSSLVLAPDGVGGVHFRAEAGGGGGAARYPVQDNRVTNQNQSSAPLTLTLTPTSGNLLILVSNSEGGTNISSVVQTNVAWSKLAESTASVAPHCEVWIGAVSGSASTTVTVTWAGSTYCGFMVSEWSGLTGTLDQVATSTNVGNQYMPAIVPTSGSALVIAAGAQTTFGAGFDNPVGRLLRFPSISGSNPTAYAAAFGFGTEPVIGIWPNAHGGTFSGVTVSIL